MNIEISRIELDGLRRQVWQFTAITGHGAGPLELRLEGWTPQARPTRRHNWKQDGEAYVRRSHNGVVHYGGRRLSASQVPFGDDVIQEARDAMLARLKVVGPQDPPEKT